MLYSCEYCGREIRIISSLKRHQYACIKNPKYNFSETPIYVQDFSEVLYLNTYPSNVQKHQKVKFKCSVCGSDVVMTYADLKTRGFEYLCRRHLQEHTVFLRYGVKNVGSLESSKLKRVNTSLQKYGVKNPIQNDIVKNKLWLNRDNSEFSKQIKQLWDNKTPKQRENQRNRCRQAALKRTVIEKSIIDNKRRKTCQEKYGSDYYQTSEIFRKNLPEIMKRSFKRYSYDNEHFDSSWELALWIYAKDHNESIKREPCHFEYTINGHHYLYFPDFLYNGKLLELKGDHYNDERTLIKLKLAKSLNIQVWYKKDVEFYCEYCRQKFNSPVWYRQFRNK